MSVIHSIVLQDLEAKAAAEEAKLEQDYQTMLQEYRMVLIEGARCWFCSLSRRSAVTQRVRAGKGEIKERKEKEAASKSDRDRDRDFRR